MANFDLVRRKGTLIDVGHMSGMVGPISPLKLSAKNLKLTSPRYEPFFLHEPRSPTYLQFATLPCYHGGN